MESNEKYISFEPWHGGYSNIRMSYEIAAAIAHITNRTLILPPKIYCLFLTEWAKKNTFFDIWTTLDKDAIKKEFKCVDFEDVPEYKNLISENQYFEKVDRVAKIILFGEGEKYYTESEGKDEHLKNQDSCITSNIVMVDTIIDYDDFNEFARGRKILNLNCPDKFIHFPKNLFGHFFYFVYGNSIQERNRIKERIKNGIKYRKEFYDIAEKVKKIIGHNDCSLWDETRHENIYECPYNAIHVRQNDFLYTRPMSAKTQIKTLLQDIENRIPNNIPLYIATDEKNKALFDHLRAKYNIWFLDNFNLNLKPHEALIVEQIICSNANMFLGSRDSTYSEYINVLRGYNNKSVYHDQGTNFNYNYRKFKRFQWETENYGWNRPFDTHWKYEKSYFNLGFFGSHNSAVAISYKAKILEVVELEKWMSRKNAAFYFHHPINDPNKVAREIFEYFKKKYGVYVFDNVIWNASKGCHLEFPAYKYESVKHHIAHVCNVIYQSSAEKSLNISFDGGSDMGFFHVFLGERGKDPEHIAEFKTDIAVTYSAIAHYLKCIKQESSIWRGNLVYGGKVMGLSSYGNRNDELVDKFKQIYKLQNTDNVNIAHENLCKILNIKSQDRIDGQLANDLAKNNQIAFEEIFKEIVTPFIEKYGADRQLQFSGGGAMNIINNTIYDAFVSPNPDDRGLALGLLLWKIKPGHVIDSTYLGPEPFDSIPKHKPYSVEQAAKDLINGEILGLIQGRCEHSARALGNRSIICLPKNGMKDILNEKVKRREFFRPFAPVVRLKDAEKYFEFGKHGRWMCHNAIVKPEWREALASITHVDNTARLQTIEENQNIYLYKLLSELEKQGQIPVLLNTSFNIQGKPILNTYAEAIWMRENTGLNKVITDKYILL